MRTLLAVTAHPDDEAFLFGGVLSLHAASGGRTGLLCLTDGQAGRTGGICDRDRLGAVRREELRRAATVLSIQHLFTPGLEDGALSEMPDDEGTALVRQVAEEFKADVLLTFGPDGASGHKDHKACWRWVRAAAGKTTLYAATFPTEPPGGKPLPVTTIVAIGEAAARKRQAFAEHRTQIDHRGRFDSIMAEFGGREFYHRVSPPWTGGEIETTIT